MGVAGRVGAESAEEVRRGAAQCLDRPSARSPARVSVAARGPGAGGLRLTPPPSSRFRMRYVASYLLAALGGNTSPSAKDIKKILDSVGIEADDDRLNKVAATLGPEAPSRLCVQTTGLHCYPTRSSWESVV